VAEGDRDKATQYFQSALKVEGGTDKARREAEQGLERTKK